jgi:hypothetical protein
MTTPDESFGLLAAMVEHLEGALGSLKADCSHIGETVHYEIDSLEIED